MIFWILGSFFFVVCLLFAAYVFFRRRREKAWLAVYEAYLFRHDLVPLLIEKSGGALDDAARELLDVRAQLCRSLPPTSETKLQIDAFEKALHDFLNIHPAPKFLEQQFHEADQRIKKALQHYCRVVHYSVARRDWF